MFPTCVMYKYIQYFGAPSIFFCPPQFLRKLEVAQVNRGPWVFFLLLQPLAHFSRLKGFFCSKCLFSVDALQQL